MRDPKGTLRLAALGRTYAAEVEARARGHRVELTFRRDDCRGGPSMDLSHDEAACLLRALQSAIDKARHAERRDIASAAAELPFSA